MTTMWEQHKILSLITLVHSCWHNLTAFFAGQQYETSESKDEIVRGLPTDWTEEDYKHKAWEQCRFIADHVFIYIFFSQVLLFRYDAWIFLTAVVWAWHWNDQSSNDPIWRNHWSDVPIVFTSRLWSILQSEVSHWLGQAWIFSWLLLFRHGASRVPRSRLQSWLSDWRRRHTSWFFQALHNLLSTYYEDVLDVKGASGESVPRPLKLRRRVSAKTPQTSSQRSSVDPLHRRLLHRRPAVAPATATAT